MQFCNLIADSKLTLKPFTTLVDLLTEEAKSSGRIVINSCTMLPSNASVTVVGVYKHDGCEESDIVVFVEHQCKLGIYKIKYDLSLDVILTPSADTIDCLGESVFEYIDLDGSSHLIIVEDNNEVVISDIDEKVSFPLRNEDGKNARLYMYLNNSKFVACIFTFMTDVALKSEVLKGQALVDMCNGLLFDYTRMWYKHDKKDIGAEDTIKLLKNVISQIEG